MPFLIVRSRLPWGLLAPLALLPAVPAAAQQLQLGVNTSFTAQGFRAQAGRRVTVVCAPVTSPGSLYGDGVYTADSSICTGAVHAGVLPPGKAGAVTFVVEGAVDSFKAAVRNGVTSLGSGPFGGSFRFDQGGEPGQLDWNTTAAAVPDGFTDPVVLVCPAGGTVTTTIWGTDSYPDDCSICVAAVHAGLFTLQAGGRVVVTRTAGQDSYRASTRNGITSQAYPSWPRSFTVAAPPAAAAIAAPNNPAVAAGAVTRTAAPIVTRNLALPGWSADGGNTALAGRTFALPGWTADGGNTTLAGRTIALPGWTADGGNTAMPPRSITLPGWTADGGNTTMPPRIIRLPGWTAAGLRPPPRTITKPPSGAQP